MQNELNLTDYEKDMLRGEFGSAKQKALEVIVKYAQALNAKALCEITKAQLFIGAYHYLDVYNSTDIDEIISEMYLNTSEKTIVENIGCFCQTDATPFDSEYWKELGISQHQFQKNLQIENKILQAGISLVGTCASYLCGFIPLMEEHYVSTESHALLLMNSLWGACANAGSIEISVCSAICGRTPLWGIHIKENRKGTHVFRIECDTKSVKDWDLLGFVIGKMLPSDGIPIITGDFKRPNIEKLKSFFASLSTSSGAEMCHIVGITPEALTLKQVTNEITIKEEIIITNNELRQVQEYLSEKNGNKLDYVSLGCPHYSLSQIQQVTTFLKNEKIHPDIILHIWTALPIKICADKSGYTDIIESAGGKLLTSSCPLIVDIWNSKNSIALDSCKQAQYIKSAVDINVYYGSMSDCLNSAINGYWVG